MCVKTVNKRLTNVLQDKHTFNSNVNDKLKNLSVTLLNSADIHTCKYRVVNFVLNFCFKYICIYCM